MDLFKFVLKSESGNISLANLQDQLDKLNQKFTEDLELAVQKISQHLLNLSKRHHLRRQDNRRLHRHAPLSASQYLENRRL